MSQEPRDKNYLFIITVVAYLVIFCSIPILRGLFLREFSTMFWILVLEHLVMTPLSIMGLMSLSLNRDMAVFGISAFVTAVLMLAVSIASITGMSDRGMGIIVFLIFPLADAVIGATGILCGLAYAIGKSIGTPTGGKTKDKGITQ